MLNTTDQLYKGGKNKGSHPPVTLSNAKKSKVSTSTFQFSFVFIKTFDFMPTFCTLPERQDCYGERVQATYPRPGNLFYSFKNIIC